MTFRQRVRINAALAALHTNGIDANAITVRARQYAAAGHSGPASYDRAISERLNTEPYYIRAGIERIDRLIANSDDNTVAKYDHAINMYNATGDDKEINALRPMIARDSVDLAMRSGEISAADIGNAAELERVLGYEPTEEMSAAIAPLSQPAAPRPNDKFAFAPPLQQQPTRADTRAYERQSGAPPAMPGYRPNMTGERARQWHGTPMGDVQVVKTATGYRAPMTGERARQWHGTPMGSADPVEASQR